jgi:hypothetical protein
MGIREYLGEFVDFVNSIFDFFWHGGQWVSKFLSDS